ncbi:MAG TPA: FG-GAP-like repeat-containing protein [Acidimicrobiales bacterium]|nr:FG-GAP-like repeat-containing protein [Acidimicrobiales bacterium]
MLPKAARALTTAALLAAGAAAAGAGQAAAAVQAAAAGAARAAAARAAAAGPALAWQQQLPGVTIRESSPVVANLGAPSVVVGGLDGRVYAYNIGTGAAMPGWPVATGAPVDSSPAAADTAGLGSDQVFVGSGDADAGLCSGGGVWSFDAHGGTRWHAAGSDPTCAGREPFQSSPAIGDVTAGGVADVTMGALGLNDWSYSAPGGGVVPGWPYYTDDTTFSSPALADVTGGGTPDVIVGGDSSPGGPIDHRGGIVRAVTGGGRTIWQFFTDDIVRSSPAVGDLGNGTSIVFGTGDYWLHQPGGASDSYKVFALDTGGHLRWSRDVGGVTMGSPALADVAGTGHADVVIGTAEGPQAGGVWVLDGNGNPLPNWAGHPSGGGVVIGGITTADLNGDGAQDLLVPTGGGVFAYDGRTGAKLFGLDEGQVSFQNSPLVTQDAPGVIGITVAGTTPGGTGVVQHYRLNGSVGAGAWPMFHHDARHTGNLTLPALAVDLCAGKGNSGYWFAARDGGVFSFCGAPFAGAGLGQTVAMAPTADGTGYWLASSTGAVRNFGDAAALGSAPGPVAAMARTPDGRGYWLAGPDGGVFAFGDAPFKGSMGGRPLNRPIVAIASTPDGGGYWLVASDGGVFSFGDATFYGSTGAIRLVQPIVGMAATPDGKGYWFVAADGGVFAFGDARFLGSTGGMHLNRPVVGMAAAPDGRGYWLVASDGGVFTFGDAPFLGSTGAIALNQPIVAIAGV